MWGHPIKIKRPQFEIFSHLYRDLLEDENKFRGLFRMNIEQFYRLSQLVAQEIRKQDTNYRRAISPEERLAVLFRMNIEQFYRLSQLVAQEIRKQDTNYRRAILPEERLAVLLGTCYKNV